jgi:hypothetical protein
MTALIFTARLWIANRPLDISRGRSEQSAREAALAKIRSGSCALARAHLEGKMLRPLEWQKVCHGVVARGTGVIGSKFSRSHVSVLRLGATSHGLVVSGIIFGTSLSSIGFSV